MDEHRVELTDRVFGGNNYVDQDAATEGPQQFADGAMVPPQPDVAADTNVHDLGEDDDVDDDDDEEEEEYGAAKDTTLQLSVERGGSPMDSAVPKSREERVARTLREEAPPPTASTERADAMLPSNVASPPPTSRQQNTEFAAGDDILRGRKKHVFILTSAGKPIFTRYGDEADFSDLFGIFQVLIAMAHQQCNDGAPAYQQAARGLRRVTSGDLCMYFHVEGELYYVLATRTGESARSCLRQMRQMHLQLISLVPNVCDILAHYPSYDMRRLISSADAGVLRQLIRRNSHEECYMFRCLAAAPLSVGRRRYLEGLLAHHFRTAFASDSNTSGLNEAATAAAAEHQLYSFFFFRGRVVCAVGPPDSDALLHVDDALLLLNFTSCLAHSQDGEIWAPFCLPKYNSTGYLWCYCTNMSMMARESRRGRIGSTSFDYASRLLQEQQRLAGEPYCEKSTPRHGIASGTVNTSVSALEGLVDSTPSAFTKSEGLLLVHIAASQLAFPALSEQAYQVSRQLLSLISPLEEELARRENIPLSLVAAEENAQQLQQQKLAQLVAMGTHEISQQIDGNDTMPLNSSSSMAVASTLRASTFIHQDGLQWFAVVLKTSQPGGEGARTIVYSEPSPAMRLSAQERKRQLRLLVKLRDQLSRSPGPLLVVKTKNENAIAMRPTSSLVALLLHQFGAATVNNRFSLRQTSESGGRNNSSIGSSTPVSVAEAMTACSRVRELMLLFHPQVPKPRMLMCAMRVLVKVAAQEGELSFQQVRGGRHQH
ncbi:putative vacuolar fusion protein MON1 B-like [Trypanosoma grayi]|uniref:putative vacuolar fusion protein MON1 B-like n=1 Tax=Trypanosoma grayi TaxID=71804 RepID=UPI0004F3F848|nr:putative vacuolar fusion protein MON1 B-like [Trypanosoma grayi]KEG15669.1 putative vacuolar fusion protein MON1 B-like [Trypanosoma grayi]